MKDVTIYTDGSCSRNPGPGGWAAILKHNGHERVITGSKAYTTNNQMELMAALEALRVIKMPCRVIVYSDSAYLINAFGKRWVNGWQRNGWRTKDKKPVMNRELWEGLLEQLERHHSVRWVKVKGHADDAANNRADRLAFAAMKEQQSHG